MKPIDKLKSPLKPKKKLPRYVVTFGVRYHTEPHPIDPDVNPDGVFGLDVDTYDEARTLAFDRIGTRWSFIHLTSEYNEGNHFPLGIIKTLKP